MTDAQLDELERIWRERSEQYAAQAKSIGSLPAAICLTSVARVFELLAHDLATVRKR